MILSARDANQVLMRLQRNRHSGPRRFLRCLSHAHGPDAVIQPDLDTAPAIDNIKKFHVLVIGRSIVITGGQNRLVDRHLGHDRGTGDGAGFR